MLERSRSAVRRFRGAATDAEREMPTVSRRDRGTPPNTVGKGPLLAAPGLTLGMAVIVRDEARHLPEWLAYHRALGVQHVFLYDNGSRDAIDEVLEPWIDHGLVTHLRWPLPGGQLDAYAHAVRFFGPSVEWLTFIDVDEFIVPLVDDDIPSLLARWPDAADVRVPRVDFGFSGHRTPPPGLTIEAFTGVADVFERDPSKPQRVKTIARSRDVAAVGIHTATVPDGLRTIGGKACEGLVQINHYYTRSFEEFEAKRFRGSATGRIARPAIGFDLPTLREDTSARRFADATRTTLELMNSLARSPYHYGSQLELTQWPRFNDLGLFAEFAFANVVAGEPEPRREPRLRLENLFEGTGFLGRLPEPGESLEQGDEVPATDAASPMATHQPRRGDLSLSPHLAPLLERTRGRLEASWAASRDAAVSTVRAGRLSETQDGWQLSGDADDAGAEVDFVLEPRGQRRCAAVGFVIRIASPTTLSLTIDASVDPGDQDASLELMLRSAGTYAGVVELAAQPQLVRGVRVRFGGSAIDVVVHDLFVIAYG